MNTTGKIFFIIVMTLVILGSLGLALALGEVLEKAMIRSEHNKCRELAIQANTYEGFYYADWEKEMCDIK